ncbi:MAG: 4Fe-4S binding protein [Candidatus Omnitrophota bacterium]
MKRKIIEINADKCNGCKLCLPNCPEGAIQMIDGKAHLVSDLFCDGLGACIGHCPQGAITITEREAEEYNEPKTMGNIIKAGPNVIKAHLKHLKDHQQTEYLAQAIEALKENNIEIPQSESGCASEVNGGGGCPGMKIIDFSDKKQANKNLENINLGSELTQWPIQLHLLNAQAPYFKNADLVIAADCVAFSYANFHQKFLKGKKLIIFCPKLDDSHEQYLEKLTEIFKNNNIKSITVVHMEVPCCFGTVSLVEEALKNSGKNIILKEYNISLQGEII